MKLTSRQRVFLEKLFDVYYRHRQQPIHYTTLARALGVANSTTYEMLKLLEQKGYVLSEYRLATDHVGPGRSMVLFRPTMKALRTFRHLLGEDARHKEWEFVKSKVLERLAAGDLPGDEQLLADLVAAIPESQDPLSYCGRVVAASLVSLKSQLLSRVQEVNIFRDMGSREASSLTLGLLPSFALGFACALRRNASWLSRLSEHVRRYQTYWHQLDEEARMHLLRFSREIMDVLQIPVKS